MESNTQVIENKEVGKEISIERKGWIDSADVKWFSDAGEVRAPKGYVDNLRYNVS